MRLYVTLRVETAPDQSVQGLAVALDDAKKVLRERGFVATTFAVRNEANKLIVGVGQ
jgi:hypothetical protein